MTSRFTAHFDETTVHIDITDSLLATCLNEAMNFGGHVYSGKRGQKIGRKIIDTMSRMIVNKAPTRA